MRKMIVAVAALALWPGAGRAGLEICNETAVERSVAVGYKAGAEWVSEGWWRLAPGQCAEPVNGALANRYYYYRATAPGEAFAGDGYGFCTSPEAFTITGDADCTARGYARADFKVIDTGATARHHVHAITGPGPAAGTGAASGSGLVRGTHGEPFAARLMFQGCDAFDGFEACTFVGNGWKYFAAYDDPTPAAFLARLEALALNTPVVVTGDLMHYQGSNAHLAVTGLKVLAGQDPHAGLRRAMQGNWVSADDPNETLYVQGSEMHRYYRAGYDDTMLLEVAADCPDSAGAGPVLIQTSVTHRDRTCYLIDNLQGGWMDLILMGHEARVSYRKAD